jgi:hypothetical protein
MRQNLGWTTEERGENQLRIERAKEPMGEGVEHGLFRKRKGRQNHEFRQGSTVCGMRIGKSNFEEIQWEETRKYRIQKSIM